MKIRRRYGLAGVASLMAHTLLVFWGFWRFDFGLDPNLEIEFDFQQIDFIDIDAEQAEEVEEPEPGVSPIPLGPELPEDGFGPEEEPEPEPEPEKQFGDKTAKVSKLAPPSATFFMLMANRRIKKMPYADDFMNAFSPQRDFKYLVDGGGFHPWNDFDYMLIASSDIRDPFQNFIVVAHKLDNRIIRAGIERAARNFNQVVEWEERYGATMTNPRPADPEAKDEDPRFFVLLDKKTAIYVREEFLQVILNPEAAAGDKKTARGFVSNLTKLRKFAAAEPKAGFTLVARDLLGATKKGKSKGPWGGELFDDLEFVFEAARAPQILAKMTFPNNDAASSFAGWWKKTLSKKINDDFKLRLMVGALYKTIIVEHDGTNIQLRAKLSRGQAEAAAKLAAQFASKLTEQKAKDAEGATTMRERSMAERLEDERRLEAGESLDTPAAGSQDGAPGAVEPATPVKVSPIKVAPIKASPVKPVPAQPNPGGEQ